MTWNPLKEPADSVWIAQRWTPGLATIEAASSPRKWEELEGYGWSGALLRFQGVGLAHFSIKIRLYTTEDWLDWSRFKPLVLKPPMGTRPRALDIWHPLLEDLEIYAMQVEDVLQPTQTADGEWTIELKCVESRQPKYSQVTPDGAQATPADPAEELIGKLYNEVVGRLGRRDNR